MSKHRKLKVLPPMACESNCGDCCGIAPATEAEYRKVLHVAKAKGITPKRQGLKCPFFQEGTCQVYDARPFACRLFGHVDRMVCTRGHNVNISPRDEYAMVMKYGPPTRVLHEALIDAGIVKTLEEAIDPTDEIVAAASLSEGAWS